MVQAQVLAPEAVMPEGVQFPLEVPYRDYTTTLPSSLAIATYNSLLEVLAERSGRPPDEPTCLALWDLVEVLAGMAEGTASPEFYLSSLDPGIGKTTALIVFLGELLRSTEHEGVAVLVCVSRLDEIRRLVKEVGLDPSDFAVLTSDHEANSLSPTSPGDARVLFTTHAMVTSKCRCSCFGAVGDFRYKGGVRPVKIWDEEMRLDGHLSLSTDQLAGLREPLRKEFPSLVELVQSIEGDMIVIDGPGTFSWPNVYQATGVSLVSAKKAVSQAHHKSLTALYALSGRQVILRQRDTASKVVVAYDLQDAIPDDLAPVVILDASGRVRETYRLWEENKRNLVRLPSATKDYRNLTISILERGAGKTAWQQQGEELAHEVAKLIDTKPDEDWLVLCHKGVSDGTIPDLITGLTSTDPSRLHFVNWGRHQGTNQYRHIRNIIVTGLHTYTETAYEMMARHYGVIPNDQEVPKTMIDRIKAGEHMHHLLQALCRSAIRQGNSEEAGRCHAYLIAPRQSGIRRLFSQVFPGCRVGTWRPTKVKAKGKVQEALTYVAMFFADYPDDVLSFTELRTDLGINDASNFRKTIRQHQTFKEGLERMSIEETNTGETKGFARITRGFTMIEASTDPWNF